MRVKMKWVNNEFALCIVVAIIEFMGQLAIFSLSPRIQGAFKSRQLHATSMLYFVAEK
jgi:hypothetical protein